MATRKTTKATKTTETAEAATTAETAEDETVVNLTADGEITAVTDETVEATAEVKTVKAKVIRTYRDKETKKIVSVGTVLDLTVERFAELYPRFVKRW